MKDNLLAIGSIVKTNQNDKSLMIIGYGYKNDETNDIYDYIAVAFPLGLISKDIMLINKIDIEDVMFIGYQTPLSIKERDKVNEYIKALKSGKTVEEASSLLKE